MAAGAILWKRKVSQKMAAVPYTVDNEHVRWHRKSRRAELTPIFSYTDNKQRDHDEEMGYGHELAGSVKKIVNGDSSVNGSSTIATDDFTSAGPDFISLDGSVPPSNNVRAPPRSDYGV